MVAVAVRERDAADRRARLLRGFEKRAAAAGHRAVDECEPVVLTDEKRVHETQPRELNQVRSELTRVHGRRNLRQVPGQRRFETNDACACRLLGPPDLARRALLRRDARRPISREGALRCLDSTSVTWAGARISPTIWSPASCRAASPPPTGPRSTSGRRPAPSAH